MSTLLTIKTLSPEDQSILEAEYARNPKPDKAARMLIVDRVALGVKEVQVSMSFPHTTTRPGSICLSLEMMLDFEAAQSRRLTFVMLDLVSEPSTDHTAKSPTIVNI